LLSKNVKIKIHRLIILPVVLYGCETWSLTLKDKCRLKDGIIGEWRNIHNGELNGLYPSPNILRVIKSRILRWAGHVARVGERRCTYLVLVWKTEGKSTLGRPRRGWEDNIKMDLKEVGCGVMDWIELAQDRQVTGCRECGNEPSDSIKCGEFLD
jgi:hypothetical protein